MRETKIGGKAVRLYDNIDELPIKNYNLMNEYALLDYEIGSTMMDIDKKFKRLDTFLVNKKIPEAIQERKNLHQTFFHAFNGTNFPALQFGCFIFSIDGKKVDDYSQENITKMLNGLGALTQGMVKSFTTDIKKKSVKN